MTLKITQAAREAADAYLPPLSSALAHERAYEAFQRAMNQAADEVLERAAGVADYYNFGPERDERDNARNATAQNIASAIRALKGQQP